MGALEQEISKAQPSQYNATSSKIIAFLKRVDFQPFFSPFKQHVNEMVSMNINEESGLKLLFKKFGELVDKEVTSKIESNIANKNLANALNESHQIKNFGVRNELILKVGNAFKAMAAKGDLATARNLVNLLHAPEDKAIVRQILLKHVDTNKLIDPQNPDSLNVDAYMDLLTTSEKEDRSIIEQYERRVLERDQKSDSIQQKDVKTGATNGALVNVTPNAATSKKTHSEHIEELISSAKYDEAVMAIDELDLKERGGENQKLIDHINKLLEDAFVKVDLSLVGVTKFPILKEYTKPTGIKPEYYINLVRYMPAGRDRSQLLKKIQSYENRFPTLAAQAKLYDKFDQLRGNVQGAYAFGQTAKAEKSVQEAIEVIKLMTERPARFISFRAVLELVVPQKNRAFIENLIKTVAPLINPVTSDELSHLIRITGKLADASLGKEVVDLLDQNLQVAAPPDTTQEPIVEHQLTRPPTYKKFQGPVLWKVEPEKESAAPIRILAEGDIDDDFSISDGEVDSQLASPLSYASSPAGPDEDLSLKEFAALVASEEFDIFSNKIRDLNRKNKEGAPSVEEALGTLYEEIDTGRLSMKKIALVLSLICETRKEKILDEVYDILKTRFGVVEDTKATDPLMIAHLETLREELEEFRNDTADRVMKFLNSVLENRKTAEDS